MLWSLIGKSDTRRPKARVAELVDAHDSKSCSARSGGSIPSTGTTLNIVMFYNLQERFSIGSGPNSPRCFDLARKTSARRGRSHILRIQI